MGSNNQGGKYSMEYIIIIGYTLLTTIATLYLGACALVGWLTLLGMIGVFK